MENPIEKLSKIQPDFDFDALIDLSDADGLAVSAIVRDASSEGTAAQAGVQTNRLQSAIENYARAMDKSAIAKSTGLPVKTSSQQYKGFIAEEYFKHTLKINALAKGIPDWKMGVYTNGTLPDGSVLSGIDEHVDISDWTRKHPWSKPMRTVDYQSKIFNDASKYKKCSMSLNTRMLSMSVGRVKVLMTLWKSPWAEARCIPIILLQPIL